jgi:hypothetical protein
MLRHQIMKLPSKDDTRKQLDSIDEEIKKIKQDIASHQHTCEVRRRHSKQAGLLQETSTPLHACLEKLRPCCPSAFSSPHPVSFALRTWVTSVVSWCARLHAGGHKEGGCCQVLDR